MLFPSISTSLFSNFLTSLFFNFYFPFACVTTLIAFSFFAVVCFHTDIICSLFQTERFKTVSVQYIFLCFFRSEGRCRRNFHPVPMYHFATRISNHKRFLVFLQFLNFGVCGTILKVMVFFPVKLPIPRITTEAFPI